MNRIPNAVKEVKRFNFNITVSRGNFDVGEEIIIYNTSNGHTLHYREHRVLILRRLKNIDKGTIDDHNRISSILMKDEEFLHKLEDMIAVSLL